MTVGMTSAVNRMEREAAAWDENRPMMENTVMADSLRSVGTHSSERQTLRNTQRNKSFSDNSVCKSHKTYPDHISLTKYINVLHCDIFNNYMHLQLLNNEA